MSPQPSLLLSIQVTRPDTPPGSLPHLCVHTTRPLEDLQARLVELGAWAVATPGVAPLPPPKAPVATAMAKPKGVCPPQRYRVQLVAPGPRLDLVVPILQSYLGLNGVAANILATGPMPKMLVENVDGVFADQLVRGLRAAGATVGLGFAK